MILFVYGSLLGGEENHAVLGSAPLRGSARTAPHYTLVDLGPYPALVEGGDTSVLGELYEVDDALIETLDAFEGHPGVYERRPVEIAVAVGLASVTPIEAYVLPASKAVGFPPIPSGDWRAR